MVKTLVALYKNASAARFAVEALLDAGFSGDDISLLVNDPRSTSELRAEDQTLRAKDGGGFGALVGALVGIGSALVPSIGPIIGAGPVAIAMTAGIGAAAGAITGGITAGLLDLGLDDEAAEDALKEKHVTGTIVSVTTNSQWLEWAERILRRFEPLKLETQDAQHYTSEWAPFERVDERNQNVGESSSKLPAVKPSSATDSGVRLGRSQIYDRD